jgi:hypothetical protein
MEQLIVVPVELPSAYHIFFTMGLYFFHDHIESRHDLGAGGNCTKQLRGEGAGMGTSGD